MPRWLRFEYDGRPGFGTVADDRITVYDGNMFDGPLRTARSLPLSAVRLLTPTAPSKMIAIWNNFHQLAAKLSLAIPKEPLYLLKAPSSFLASGNPIRKPKSFDGKVVFEGELGVVIGKTCKEVTEADAAGYIFGYTCINDVTAADIINCDPAFPQWVRAKSYDTFGVFGPVIATGLDPLTLTVRTILDGNERQAYPVTDIIVPPARLVSLISHDMTLEPGDVICCGTSVGVGTMKPGSTVEVVIAGIGTLRNTFDVEKAI